MRVCVVQKDLKPLKRFFRAIKIGKIWKKKTKGNCFMWYASAHKDVLKVFKLLKPFLSAPKKEQFKNAFDIWDKIPRKWSRV